MPLSLPATDIKPGILIFMTLSDFEGEFAVGMSRVVAIHEESISWEWLKRRGWSNDPMHVGFAWGNNPIFYAHKTRGRTEKVTEALSEAIDTILPVLPTLTATSQHDPSKPLVHKDQRIRLAKTCVEQLREFCTQRRPALVQTAGEAGEEEGEEEDSENSEDEEVEGELEEEEYEEVEGELEEEEWESEEGEAEGGEEEGGEEEGGGEEEEGDEEEGDEEEGDEEEGGEEEGKEEGEGSGDEHLPQPKRRRGAPKIAPTAAAFRSRRSCAM